VQHGVALALLLCLANTRVSQGYLLSASLHWDRIGATPQFYSKGGVYGNFPCGRNTPTFTGNPNCGNPEQGIADATQYPEPFLMHLTLALVVDCQFWVEKALTTAGACPGIGTLLPFGVFCLDAALGTGTSSNCDLAVEHKVMYVDTTSSPKMVYTQFVRVWDYSGSINADLYSGSPPPPNVTAAFNWTAPGDGIMYYDKCPDLSSGNPCFCQTIDCSEASEAYNHWGPWTVESVIPFSSSTTLFTDNVTPATNHHSPRIHFPAIVSVPGLKVGEELKHPFAAADEDGSTRLTFQVDPDRSVLSVTSDGMLYVKPLLARGVASGNVLAGGSYEKYLFRSHYKAIDPVNPSPKVFSQLLFYVRICPPGGNRVAIQSYEWGLQALRLGATAATFANIGTARCMGSNGTQLGAVSQASCTGAVGTWHAVWMTAPTTHTTCAVNVACRVPIYAVKLNFTDVMSCRWSDAVGEASRPLCATRLHAGVAIVMDSTAVVVTGEHTIGTTSGAANPAFVTIQPFQGRENNGYPKPNPYEWDIGRKEMFCLIATANDGDYPCPSLPHCVTVEVKGTIPELLSPSNSPTCPVRARDDFLQYVGMNSSNCPDLFACWRSTTGSEVTLKAFDADLGETVNIVVDSISSLDDYSATLLVESALAFPDASDVGGNAEIYCDARTVVPYAPFMAVTAFVTPRATKDCRTALRKVTFDLDYATTGASPIAVNRTDLGGYYPLIGEDKVLCYTVTDNQAKVWGRGVSNSYGKCHIVRMRGAPVFVINPATPLDTPFSGVDAQGLGFGELVLTARLAVELNFTFRARDPDPEDQIQILLLEDPGLPNEAILDPQVCVDQGLINNIDLALIPRKVNFCSDGMGGQRVCPTVASACQEAFRFFHWVPSPGSEGKAYMVCAVAKDDDGACGLYHKRRNAACNPDPTVSCGIDGTDGASDKSTSHGYYGPEHCVIINVTAPNPTWDVGTVPTVSGANKLAHVGCEIRWKVAATDANGYTMHVQVAEDTPLPDGARMVPVTTGVTAHQDFAWTPVRGMEGSMHTVCFQSWALITYPSNLHAGPPQARRARNADGSAELPRRCVNIKVRRCKYCVDSEETLLVKMKEYSVDMNWLRLWAANGNDDGDDLTDPVEDPGVLGTGTLDGVHNGQLLNIGPVYKFQAGDSLMGIAGRFRTTLKSLLDLNPDITDPSVVQAGQEVCLIPCSS